MTTNNQFNGKLYDEVWTDRFTFFQENGEPSSKKFKEALKLLPAIKKMRMNINFYALFFGFIYFLVKGMFKGAITLVLVSAILGCISVYSPDFVGRIIYLIILLLGAYTANYTYYRKEVLNEDDFNIFKGMRF